ncbi:hypothetical protein QO010_002224 [Caulobacter ginsengisoli]|uniref:DUF2855 domain-containing protein n=1 Tax=Caulobacter ginsengisoli TaxID=400775 RepID=A0ABU0ITG1_9CAUL|nr:DUF2855 family protein [Caulobacter ginsengisoli]MDQ0464443.1 hypothetical protein [Caulobacter ginsengisoli]
MTATWDFLIGKDDLARTERREGPAPDAVALEAGEALLEVERFALTANNITYGAMGEAFGYWRFFPAPEGWGRIPVWGFARVVRSNVPDVAVGTRVFGYLPMSSHFKAQLRRTGHGLVDAAAHRAELPPTYNQYSEVLADDGLEDYRALLRPLFMTSFVIDDWLARQDDLGAGSVLMSSASSKTALGLAWLLARRGVKVTGLTSEGNRAFLEGLGFFDQVAVYGDIPTLETRRPVAYIDFAGNPAVVLAVHSRFGDDLVHSAIVGVTHWKAGSGGGGGDLPGPKPVLFFAPDHIRARIKASGQEGLDRDFTAAMSEFVRANPWLKLEHHAGPDALAAIYAQVLEGRASPDTGHIITLA